MLSKVHSVVLENFKSYHGTIAVGPLKDLTCIVGPNGAGKSNLMDALSFVLSNDGNNSPSNSTATTTSDIMRSKTPTDLIHRTAKATGAGCSVTLILQHQKKTAAGGDEAAVNRTNAPAAPPAEAAAAMLKTSFCRAVEPTGSIRCRINGKEVSQAKFSAALAEHRIGPRLHTFLIFQHQVEAVARKKAAQLTELLEQVSGSAELESEYCEKKAALQEANAALARTSVEKREAALAVAQMRLVKKDVEKYNQLQKQLEQMKQGTALTELLAVELHLDRQKAELQRLSSEVAALEKRSASEQKMRELKRNYTAKHKTYLEGLRSARKLTDELRLKLNTVQRIETALAHLTRRHEQQTQDLATVKKADTIRSAEVCRLEDQLKKQKGLLQNFEEQCVREDAEGATINSALAGEQLEEYRQLRKEADCATVALRQQRETVLRQRESAQEAVKQCERAMESHGAQHKQVSQAIQQASADGQELQRRHDELQENIARLQREMADARQQMSLTQEKNMKREAELVKVQEQLHELRHMKDSNKQNTRMADALQALRSLFPIHGRLVDLCTVPNDRYRSAVTVAMGKNLESLVVESTAVAISCVKYLKEQRLPPMTFLPLDSIKGSAVDDRLRTFGGTCKPIVDVVQYSSDMESAVQYALGQTLLCDGITEAKTIAYGRPNGERFKVVTLDGTVLLKNGSVQGGLASIQTRAKKWDEKRYDDLRATRERLVNEMASSGEAELARQQIALRDMEARIDFWTKRCAVVAAEQQASAPKVQRLTEEMAKIEERGVEIRQRQEAYTAEFQLINAELLRLSKAVAQVEGRIFADFQKKINVPDLLQLEGRQVRLAKERAEKRQQLLLMIHKLETSLDVERKRTGATRVSDLEEACTRLLQNKDQCKKDLATYREIVDKATAQHQELKKTIAKHRTELDELERVIRQSTRSSETDLGRLVQARKMVTSLQASCDALRLQRLNIARRCQMDGVSIPLLPAASTGSKRSRVVEEVPAPPHDGGPSRLLLSEPFALLLSASSSAGGGAETQSSISSSSSTTASAPSGIDGEVLVSVDFSSMSESMRVAAADRGQLGTYIQHTEASVESTSAELESLLPSIRAAPRCHASEGDLERRSAELEKARERARKEHDAFARVKEMRTERFMAMYEKVAATVDQIYCELTMGTRANAVHGSAYLSLEDMEEPYLGGTTYHAAPPLKRFMPMELLSGGERTMAALALLFAIHEVCPTPFFVLDEVDAALDAGNVEKLASYLRKNSRTCQFVVVSLKDHLYHVADMLVGVMKDKERESSKVVTMDLRGYPY